MKGQHPWRYGESVQIDDNFDASKIQHVLDHIDSDCVDKAPEVSVTNRATLLLMAPFLMLAHFTLCLRVYRQRT